MALTALYSLEIDLGLEGEEEFLRLDVEHACKAVVRAHSHLACQM